MVGRRQVVGGMGAMREAAGRQAGSLRGPGGPAAAPEPSLVVELARALLDRGDVETEEDTLSTETSSGKTTDRESG